MLSSGLVWAIEKSLLFYFFYTSVYNFIFSFSSLFKGNQKAQFYSEKKTFAILVPAYREDNVIVSTTTNLLCQDYPENLFTVVVIADSLKPETLKLLRQEPVKVLEVRFDESTKVKSLNAAFQYLNESYDICVVVDADNFLDRSFLARMDDFFNSGYHSVQGMRIPKNSDSTMAFLDGLSEAINNKIVRKGTCNLGGSSAIVGSGFAVDYQLMKDTLSQMDSVSGFDKELEIRLLENDIKTIYSEELIIYDEKVTNSKDFRNQRRRWIFSQFFYLRKYFKVSMRALFNRNFALFNSAFLRYAQLPRFINMIVLFIVTVIFTILHYRSQAYLVWWGLFFLSSISILLAIPAKFYNIKLLKAVLELPRIFLIMFGLLFKLKKANKKFLHTPHQKTTRDL